MIGAPTVLITAEYPCGFCPLHCFEGIMCHSGCWPIRVKFAKMARDLEHFWHTADGRAHLVTRKDVA